MFVSKFFPGYYTHLYRYINQNIEFIWKHYHKQKNKNKIKFVANQTLSPTVANMSLVPTPQCRQFYISSITFVAEVKSETIISLSPH